MEFLIPILFFAVPLAITLLDKRAKARKGESTARPVRPGGVSRSKRSPTPRAVPFPRTSAPSPEDIRKIMEKTPAGTPLQEEGVRAIHRPEKGPVPAENPGKPKIDKKKLILYSEILKPRFDA